MAWRRPLRREEQRVRAVDTCACCGKGIDIGGEKLTWLVLGDRALIHMACHARYLAGERVAKQGDVF